MRTKSIIKVGLVTLSIIIYSCQTASKKEKGKTNYKNPVVAQSLPDPTIIKAADGFYYLYATENTRNVPIYQSKNLVDWTFSGTAFTDSTRPNFEPQGGIWAPDINFIDGKYVMYYSMSVWGGEWTCGIGVATADNPQGPFTDRGKLFRSNEIGVQNSIDPFYMEDNGAKYLFWGSFRGIYCTELSADGLGLKDSSNSVRFAGTAFEGSYIFKKDSNYYYFASIGSCCEGINSTYQLVVARSKSLMGPYTNKAGINILDNGYEVVISKNERFVGNGHCSEIVTDTKGQDWIIYHGVDVTQPEGRVLMLDQMMWDADGWPVVQNHQSPSLEAACPVY